MNGPLLALKYSGVCMATAGVKENILAETSVFISVWLKIDGLAIKCRAPEIQYDCMFYMYFCLYSENPQNWTSFRLQILSCI